jgi:hypothetical protein
VKTKKPRIDIGEDSTIELERDWAQILGERHGVVVEKMIISDDQDICDGLYSGRRRCIRLKSAYPTLDAFGTAWWEEVVHGICDHGEIDIPHDKQVVLAHGIWLASATLHDMDWWR